MRLLDAYLNFLMGKGSGAGWDLAHEIKVAASCITRPDPVVFDVGANVGDWSAGFQAMVPNARLFLFEPLPAACDVIRQRNLRNAVLIPCAVGDAARRARFYFALPTARTASLYPRRESYFQHREYECTEVEVVTLDQMIAEHRIAFVDFMKMDIEGHELRALEGAQIALNERRIGALSFEFGSGNINSRTFFHDIWEFLTNRGFKLSRITPSGRLLPIEEYYEDCEYFRGVSNYIAQLAP
jgi:FkbM family methyltransferase